MGTFYNGITDMLCAENFEKKSTLTIISQMPQYETDLYRYAASLLPYSIDADDLVQETFYRALRYSNRFDVGMSLKGWLFTILRNVFLNDYKRTKMSQELISNSHDLTLTQLYYCSSKNKSEENLIAEEIDDCISNLPVEYYHPIKLFLDGYKYDEIASVLDVPLGTVKFRIFAARRILKKQLVVYKLRD